MPEIPKELSTVAEDVSAGRPRHETVRNVLSWFGQQRRGRRVVDDVRWCLRKVKLITEPDFESVWIDGQVEFKPRPSRKANGAATVETTSTQGPPSGQTPAAGTDAASVPPIAVAADDAGDQEPTDPSFSVGKLKAANCKPVSVDPATPIETATTKMILRDFSQLPVLQNGRKRMGLFSWKSLGIAARNGQALQVVSDAMESEVQAVPADTSVFTVARLLAVHPVVLILQSSHNDTVVGIVSASDVAEHFGTLGEPFLRLAEIEHRLRSLIDEKLDLADIKAARDSKSDRREIESAADLTFGEYGRLLGSAANWAKLGLALDRVEFVNALDAVRKVRNDVVHFDPDPIGLENLETLRLFAKCLATLGVGHSPARD
jgi:CBS domain-containing protein